MEGVNGPPTPCRALLMLPVHVLTCMRKTVPCWALWDSSTCWLGAHIQCNCIEFYPSYPICPIWRFGCSRMGSGRKPWISDAMRSALPQIHSTDHSCRDWDNAWHCTSFILWLKDYIQELHMDMIPFACLHRIFLTPVLHSNNPCTEQCVPSIAWKV